MLQPTARIYSEYAFTGTPWRDDPFPHAVIDGAWDPLLLRAARREFPAYDDPRWIGYNDPEEVGKKAGAAGMWGPATREFFREVRSAEFAAMMETGTDIRPLTGDDVGGGMHVTGPGGRLEMHIDFNLHPTDPGLERRLNLLVFLNDEWDRDWGGVLYLGRDRSVEVLPLFNRTVVFECSDESFHGHPDPIIGEHYRRSLACYFYAPTRADASPAHSTVWSHSG